MRRRAFLLVTLLAPVVPGVARSDEKQVCSDAYTLSQTLRDDHKLREARDQLRICGRATCPGFITKECTAWLADVEARMPSVVFVVKDRAGADRTDVKVWMDGVLVATSIDGHSIDANPGPHALKFEANDGARLEQQVVVREGVKDQQVAVTLGKEPPVAQPASSNPAPPSGAGAAEETGTSSWKTVGFALGGLGAAGLVVGTVFGLIAITKNNSAGCDATSLCQDPQARRDAQSAATPSTIAFIAGGALLGTGIVLVLTAPGPARRDAARVEATPFVAPGAGGVSLRGFW